MPTEVVCPYLERKGDPRSPYTYCNRRAAQVRPGQSGCNREHCRTYRWQAPVRDTVRDVDEDTPLIIWAQRQVLAGASMRSVAKRIGCSDVTMAKHLQKPPADEKKPKSTRRHRKLAPLPSSGPTAPAGEHRTPAPNPDPATGASEIQTPGRQVVHVTVHGDVDKLASMLGERAAESARRPLQTADIDGSPFGDDRVRRCRVCGCTDDHACPGGCEWVEDDLCSACADLPVRPTRQVRDALERAGLVPRPESEIQDLVAGIPEEVIRAFILDGDLFDELEQFYAGWRRCLQHLRVGPELASLRDALTAGA